MELRERQNVFCMPFKSLADSCILKLLHLLFTQSQTVMLSCSQSTACHQTLKNVLSLRCLPANYGSAKPASSPSPPLWMILDDDISNQNFPLSIKLYSTTSVQPPGKFSYILDSVDQFSVFDVYLNGKKECHFLKCWRHQTTRDAADMSLIH